LDLLEDLKQKAEKQLSELRREETNSRFNFESMKMALQDQIVISNKEIVDTKEAANIATETKAIAEGDLAIVVKELTGDKERLTRLERECATAASEHDGEVKKRTEEIETIQKAIVILKRLLGDGPMPSFVQIDSNHDGFEVVNFLRQLAQKQENPTLAQLAARISTAVTRQTKGHRAGADPFKVIKDMIKSMIDRLEREMQTESTHKEYCDKELKDTKDKKGELVMTQRSYQHKLTRPRHGSNR
jgi:hypothetical protein